jgi:hypothetical protein
MIVWPDEKRMKSEGREGVRRFRDTSAAAELEASKEKWTVIAWPWTSEPPLRVMLENERHEVVSVTMNEGGMWLLADEARSVHIRSIESLERDARGLPGERPQQPGTAS